MKALAAHATRGFRTTRTRRAPAALAWPAVGFFRRKPMTRAETVAAADQARARGRVKKAVALYQEALRTDPDDPTVNTRIAPLLAKLGDADGGTRAYRKAAEVHLKKGFLDRASAVVTAAAGTFPHDAGFRLEGARINLSRGRRQDAVNGLVDGGRALRRARRLDAAGSLLRRALEIEPRHVEATLALAPVLAASGSAAEARTMLAALERTARGRDVARVRWVTFRLRPSPVAFFRWLAAALRR
jgi:Tfp pilus assembly protein PilF